MVKKLVAFLFIITLLIFLTSSHIYAYENNKSIFSGLYLIGNDKVTLNNVKITITVVDKNTTKITAKYEIINKESSTQYLNMGTPISDLNTSSFLYKFTPYKYNSKITSGDKVNSSINGLEVSYKNWRTYSFEIPIKPEEVKTAEISYNIKNNEVNPGKLVFDIDLDHLKSWGTTPNNTEIKVFFNPKTVQMYNFDNDFSVKPSKMNKDYSLSWVLNPDTLEKNIVFNYYEVNGELINILSKNKDPMLNSFINYYNKKEYTSVIETGKRYIENNAINQSTVYLLMADAYIEMDKYREALILYDLIETEFHIYEDLQEKIRDKVLYNKIICYYKLENYEELYDLLEYWINDQSINKFLNEWLIIQRNKIPDEALDQILLSRKEASTLEKLVKYFVKGSYTKRIGIIGTIIILLIIIITIIIRKKKNDRYFF